MKRIRIAIPEVSRFLMALVLIPALVGSIFFFSACKKGGKIPVIDMVSIEGGEFMMGSANGASDEQPVHLVRVDGFYLGRTEVTVSQWEQFITDTGYITDAEKLHNGLVKLNNKQKRRADANWKNPYLIQNGEHPVVLVSWRDARAFCRWLEKKTGIPYRLPTEAEWEFACRGGTGGDCGDYYGDLDAIAWYETNSNGVTHPVGQKQPNSLGLYDMLGNVWEWCQDCYDKNYYSVSPALNPPGAGSGNFRVSRGGSWCSKPERLRASFRKHDAPVFCFYRQGFRVARSR